MKQTVKFITYLAALFFVCAVMMPSLTYAAAMTDYCASPPFIQRPITPNLLLMIDNSASMFDLEYVDVGKKVCSTTQTTVCTTNEDCPAGETCSVVRRNATYCYDESFNSRKTYYGYFDKAQFYQYDLTNDYFYSVPTFPADQGTCAGTHTAKYIANTLCAELDGTASPKTLIKFIASGNYMNWLSASKFDVEKGILTGGKYGNLTAVTKGLLPESRGCVGRKFIKEAITADFQNYDACTPPAVCDPNTSLEITFGVRGPVDTNNPTNVSKGGQTFIDIFDGNYDSVNCQAAIDLYASSSATKEEIVKAVDLCLSNAATNKKTCSLDFSASPPACSSDSDCAAIPGTCDITAGSCDSLGGVCGVSTAGTCTANNGSCTGAGKCVGGNRPGTGCTRNQDCTGNGACMATCAGGRWAGSTCVNDASCAYSACSAPASKAGSACTINSDCDIKNCTNAGANFGKSCSADAQCNVGTCTAPPSKLGVFCSVASDCNIGTCPAGSPANANGPCTTDAQCSTSSKGFCMAPVTTQIKSTFTQSMNSCYQFMKKDVPIGTNEVEQVSNPNGCNQIYKENKICNGGTSDGDPCDTIGLDVKCPGGACINGPEGIRIGSPVLLCNTQYAGYCATTTDNWVTTMWIAREYASSDDCIKAKYSEYCGAVEIPPVVDPTDDPSNTTNYNNLPAIISDVSISAQLRDPIRSLTARVKRDDAPAGLIQDFSSTNAIRFGAMSFDFNGSRTECGTRDPINKTATGIAYCTNNIARACTADTDCGGTGQCVPAVPCPYVCDNAPQTACTILPDGSNRDCDAGVSCVLSTSFLLSDPNLDGGHVMTNSYIGNPVPLAPDWGHGAAGVINDIDNLTADAWTPFSEGFYNAIGYYALTATTVTPMRLDSSDFNTTPVPSQYKCQKNNVLLITDGQSTADLNKTVTDLVSTNSALLPAGAHYDTAANNMCVPYAGSRNIESLAWLAQNRNIQNMAETPASSSQKVATYVVYSGTGSLDSTSCPSADITTLNWDCQPDNLMCKTARYGGGKYYLAQDPATLAASLKSAFTEISTAAASGTAASVLASGEGSGANLVQAIFYPVREVGTSEVDWTGRLQNFWYFIDPRLGNSTIMEDTDFDKALKLSQDNNVAFVYDPTSHQTTVTTTSPGGVVTPNVSLSNVHYLWEAGSLLLGRTAGTINPVPPIPSPLLSTTARRIFTNTRMRGTCSTTSSTNCGATADCPADESCVITDNTLDAFDTAAASVTALTPFLNVTDTANLIKYVRGIDDLNGNGIPSRGTSVASPVYTTDSGDTIDGVQVRNRTVTDTVTLVDGSSEIVTDVWKLGDIVNSTPKILSWVPANTYYEIYSDETYKTFTSTTDYRSRGMVFAGANDGMLHAFKLGLLGLSNDADLKATMGKHCSGDTSKGCNTNSDCGADTCTLDSDLGREMWAFIPKNSLPYLKYMADPNYKNCHVYFIDAQPFIFDASFVIDGAVNPAISPAPPPADECTSAQYWNCTKSNLSWRTVLIGSMRLGGACKNTGSSCQDCTKTPMTNLGYSSYFALDITDPVQPKLLWEFSNRGLGFSTSGPAIVRVTNPHHDKKYSNGRWLAVFGSGPTGWISQNNNMAMASVYERSIDYFNYPHNMKLFVVDAASGQLITTIDTGEQATFAGSLLNGTMDFDQDDLSKKGNYQDDAVYFGYTQWNSELITPSSGSSGCAPSVAGNTLVLNGSPGVPDDYYNGYFVDMWKWVNATGWNYEGFRLITSYKAATQTVTLDSSWPVTPDPTSLTCSPTSMWYRITKGWTKGGVKRLLTNQDIDPTKWAVSSVIDGIGPVTASVKKLQKYSDNSVRLYFGSGRYYYRLTDLLDDPHNLRALYGIKEPCYTATGIDASCTAAVTTIGEAATAAGIDSADPSLQGWWIGLDGCRDTDLAAVDCLTASGVANPAAVFKAERVVTDPLAATSGGIFFSSIVPTSDPCEYGGRSYLWAVRYDTGGTLVPTGILKGKAIIQRSTGDIEQIDLATAFKADHGGLAGERKTSASFGLTGSGGISIVVPPQPLNRIMHIQKR